jgi:hypothetical protein
MMRPSTAPDRIEHISSEAKEHTQAGEKYAISRIDTVSIPVLVSYRIVSESIDTRKNTAELGLVLSRGPPTTL